MRQAPKKETLIVDFYEVDTGWLRFKLTAGKETFTGRFSEVWDPLLDFKHWLEAISVGANQTSFTFDPEGNDIKFDFQRRTYDTEMLIISETYNEENTFINSVVDRKQIVKAFYLGLLNFANSDKFKSNEWEIEYIKERLCKALKMDETRIIEILLELDRKKLGEFLFNADPIYTISFPSAKDKREEIVLFYETSVQGNPVPDEHVMKETPNEWHISKYYDYWQTSKKRAFIIDCINERTNGYRGTKINDFRSKLIEQYLEDE